LKNLQDELEIQAKAAAAKGIENVPESAMVSVTRSGTHLSGTIMLSNRRHVIKRMKEGLYVNTETGELKPVTTRPKDAPRNPTSRNQSFRQLRNLIYANFTGGGAGGEYLVTLEFTANSIDPTDLKQVKKTFKVFTETGLNRSFRQTFMQRAAFIVIFEPHQNGQWHAHLLLKGSETAAKPIEGAALYKWLADHWTAAEIPREAFTTITTNSGLAQYFYLPSYKAKTESTSTEHIANKARRFSYYPQGVKFWGSSRGKDNQGNPLLVQPTKETCSAAEFLTELADQGYSHNRIHQNTYIDDQGKQRVNSIVVEADRLTTTESAAAGDH
jgi:hypothetical protein